MRIFFQQDLLLQYNSNRAETTLHVSTKCKIIIFSKGVLESITTRVKRRATEKDEHHQPHGHPQRQVHEGQQEETPTCTRLSLIIIF